jgi:CRISPR/Cas system-associated endonuclease/helicase Cas3
MPKSASAQKILNEIGDPKAIARELRAFRKSAQILSSNKPRLIDVYPDKWIAVYKGKVQAAADSLEAILARAKKLKLPKENYFIRYIARKRKTMIFSGQC